MKTLKQGDKITIRYKGKLLKVSVASVKGNNIKLLRTDGPGSIDTTIDKLEIAERFKRIDIKQMIKEEVKLLFEGTSNVKIGGIEYIVTLNTNIRGVILQFTFASGKELDKYTSGDKDAIKKQVELYVQKKLGLKNSWQQNNDLGGISIIVDKNEIIKKILR